MAARIGKFMPKQERRCMRMLVEPERSATGEPVRRRCKGRARASGYCWNHERRGED